jgi:hypothetical protein
MHRFVWDLRYGTAPGGSERGGGPLVVPGTYQVRLKVGELVETKPLEVKIDPRVAADGVTIADLQEQLDLLRQVQAASSEAREAAATVARAIERLSAAGGNNATVASLKSLQSKLVTADGPYPQPMLIDQLSSISRMAGSADQKVGRSTFEYLEELRKRLTAIQAEAKKLDPSIPPKD